MNYLKNLAVMIDDDHKNRKLYAQAREVRKSEELELLKLFLESNKLPSRDISLEGNVFSLYYDDNNNIIGSAGFEMYGDVGIVRSIAVHQTRRRTGLGRQIVDEILRRAKGKNLKAVFLLTETAYEFFLRKGFHDFSRHDVPFAVSASSEFSSVCPATAKCMIFKFREQYGK
jgi:amino-acid N-acetyltransferase